MFHFNRATVRIIFRNVPGYLRSARTSLRRQVRRAIGVPLLIAAFVSTSTVTVAEAADVAETPQQINIPAGTLADALDKLGDQSGVQIMYEPSMAGGIKVAAVNGTLTIRDALTQLLSQTGLKADRVNDKTVVLRRAAEGDTTAGVAKKNSSSNANSVGPVEEIVVRGIPEILVYAKRSLNTDIERTADDPQPYVVFDRVTIEASGAVSVQDFLKQRLPMNTQANTPDQGGGSSGNLSQINLRGFGTNQTLILVDGRRKVSPFGFGNPAQPDLNGIPIAAIERIEVLPTTASGIYGGSATGGVVNVILRRDYSGVETRLRYENAFDTDVAKRNFDISAGFNLENGRTNVLVAASYSDANQLLERDRGFIERGRQAILDNNPAFLLNATTPPLGATPNIRSANGSPLFGPGTSNFTSVPVGYAGGGGQTPFAGNAGTYNLDLANSAQLGAAGYGLANGPTLKSIMATARRDFTDDLQMFVEGSASSNAGSYTASQLFAGSVTIAANAPNNPFGQAISVRIPANVSDDQLSSKNEDMRAAVGAIMKLPRDWVIGADYTWNRSTYQVEGAPNLSAAGSAAIANGTIDVLRDTNAYPLDLSSFEVPGIGQSPIHSTLNHVALRIAGPVGGTPAGPIRLSALVEHLDERFGDGLQFAPPSTTLIIPSRSQNIDSIYLEARVPLWSQLNARPLLQELEFQVAGRYDDYTVNGVTGSIASGSTTPVVRATNKNNSINPTLALRYRPIKDVMLRLSYGTGFLAPTVNQLLASAPVPANAGFATDPRRGNSPTPALQLFGGGNPILTPEESESWSAGIVLEPQMLAGLRLSLDYTRIKKTEGITTLLPQTILDNEALFPDRVRRGPVPSSDPFGVGPVVSIDRSLVNISEAEVETYDASLDYSWETARFGRFNFYTAATWLPHSKTRLSPVSPVVENAGISTMANFIPVKFKANGGLIWNYRDLTLGWTSRYIDSYVVSTNAATILNQGSLRVADQIYHDVFGGYRFSGRSGRRLSDVEIQFGIRNALDAVPPLDMSNSNTFYSFFGDARLRSYFISLRKSF